MIAYAIWAPGVGYMTHANYPHVPTRREHNGDIRKAELFGDISELLSTLRKGVTDMTGLEIRKIEQRYVDVGTVE